MTFKTGHVVCFNTDDDYLRQGVARSLMDYAENLIGYRLYPNTELSVAGAAFFNSRGNKDPHELSVQSDNSANPV